MFVINAYLHWVQGQGDPGWRPPKSFPSILSPSSSSSSSFSPTRPADALRDHTINTFIAEVAADFEEHNMINIKGAICQRQTNGVITINKWDHSGDKLATSRSQQWRFCF